MSFDFKIFDFFKLPIKIMLAISIATGLILFLPDSLIHKIYLFDFRYKYGFSIGILFLISVSIIFVKILALIFDYFRHKFFWKKFIDTSKDRLSNLDDYQKAIVYFLYQQDNHTEELPINDGAVIWLRHNMIITETTTQYIVSDLKNAVFPYMLNPWVVETLNKDEKLLDSFYKSFEKSKNKNWSN